MALPPEIVVAPPVRAALTEGRPVVALETAVLTHGLPRPTNREAVAAMAAAIEAVGATPAIIAVVDGRLRVGLDDDALVDLGENRQAHKLGARDLAWAMSAGVSGGTTVSGTLVGARLAGVEVFATGGIGGVHRGWRDHRDISSDLEELARTPCCTVSAGAKSILDLPATLEALESLAIPVLGWRTEVFPQFYARGTDDLRVRKVDELAAVAELCRLRWRVLEQPGGVLLTQPLAEEHALDQAVVDRAVADAVAQASALGIRGQDLTPFLLAALSDLTVGASLTANLALLVANARLAARLACALKEPAPA
ncbi:MAG: pseudouridine-5'-phosphate glycosidase [Myxococcales bacterium]|nr:pseudouridine-5'-phosphate glycosidase [Myxococcales bacterium]